MFARVSLANGPPTRMLSRVNIPEAPDVDFCDLIRSFASSHDNFANVYAERHGVYQTDFRALVLIKAGDDADAMMTAGRLAQALKLSSGAVTYLVERLAASSHVRRAVDPADRRKVLLTCTQRGGDLVEDYALHIGSTLDAVLRDVGPAERQQLRTALVDLAGALEDGAQALAPEMR